MSPNVRGYTIAGALALGFALLVLWSVRARPTPQASAAPSASGLPPLAPDAATLLAVCDELGAEYKRTWANLSFCQSDADCAVEERGKYWSGLDGCVRTASRAAPKGAADQIAEEWLAQGCAHEVDACPAKTAAQCRDRRCVELPPAPIPRDWNRVRVPDIFTLFVPGDLAPKRTEGEDTIVRALEGGGRELFVSWGTNYDADEPDADGAERFMPWVKIERRQPITASGRATTLFWTVDRGERGDAKSPFVAEALVPNVAAPWYFMFGGGAVLFQLRCEKREQCDVAPVMLGSLEIVSQPFDPKYP